MDQWIAAVKDKLRGSALAVAALICFVLVALFIATESALGAKILFAILGVSRLVIAAFVAYWIDRTLFPYARPHELEGTDAMIAQLRRALIVASAIIAMATVP